MAKTLLVLCFLILLFSIPVKSMTHDDEEFFFFDGFTAASSNMSLSGAASIEPNGLLHLTNDTLGLTGNAFYSTPIKFKNSTTGKAFSFSTAFAFAIFNWFKKPTGQCFAFSFSPSKALPSQHLSLINPKQILYQDLFAETVRVKEVKNFFYVVFNGKPYRVDIDLNRLKSNAHVIYSEYFYGGLIQAWLDYDSSNNQLEIRLSPNSSKPILPILSWNNVDLSPILNETMYVGFSASTTVEFNRQYIAGWSFKVNGGEATSLDLETLPSLLPVLTYRDSVFKKDIYHDGKLLLYFLAFTMILRVVFVVVVKKKKNNNNDKLERQRFKEL